jgi:hypothetical protein
LSSFPLPGTSARLRGEARSFPHADEAYLKSRTCYMEFTALQESLDDTRIIDGKLLLDV